jgi:chloramphenicol O-acetyltransferase type B
MRKFLNKLRNFLNFNLRYRFVKYGADVHIQWNVEIFSPNKIVSIGSHVGINSGTVILSDVEIGDYVLIAPRCGLINRAEHIYNNPKSTIYEGGRARSELIVIEDDVWIGYGSTILGGVRIGQGTIVAANSLVMNDVPPYSIVAGNPAKVIKQRFNKQETLEHKLMMSEKSEKK